jgi:hypothetical protein
MQGTIHPLSKGLIERALDRLDVRYRRDSEGDVAARIAYDSIGSAMTYWFLILGEHCDVFQLLSTVDATIPMANSPQALVACNQYHAKYFFGRGYIRERQGDQQLKLCFDAIIDLERGTTEDFLKEFIELHIYAARKFFEIAHEEYKLF